ncbi:alpha-glucosidase/alpha-galactosidase [Candidatus Bathyarchaeota archaeon]|nr:alpha-glucosidase/alpha-galactosidase [Candidatus Bathyarchaeota archaeon]
MTKITIIGAGSNAFGLRMIKDIAAHAMAPESPLEGTEIALMDIDEKRLGYMHDIATEMKKRNPDLPLTFTKTTDRRNALKEAGYCITMIHPGGSKAIVLDAELPLKYGEKVGRTLAANVNDTMSAGGIMRGARTIPVLKSILDDMADVSKTGALLLNYSNPMAMNTWAMADHIEDEGYDLHCVGLCHGTWFTAILLRAWCGATPDEFAYTCVGINHMAWYTDLRMKDFETGEWRNAYPVIRENLEEEPPPSSGKLSETLRREIMYQFGYFCTESSGHLSEYLPFPVRVREDLRKRYFHDTRVGLDNRKLDGARKWSPSTDKEKFEERMNNDKTFLIPNQASNEYASWIIEACETDLGANILPKTFYFHGNVRNDGLITNLPQGCCVEVPCMAMRPGWGHDRPVVPTYHGALPPQCAALCQSNIRVQELVVLACKTREPEYLRYAMMLDPHISQVLEPRESRALADELLDAEKQWLPQFA